MKQAIDEKAAKALDSFDGAQQATPRPFLFTRISARMKKEEQDTWAKAGRLLARPSIAFAGLALVLGINAMVLFNNDRKQQTNDQAYTTDEYSTTVATLYNFENGE